MIPIPITRLTVKGKYITSILIPNRILYVNEQSGYLIISPVKIISLYIVITSTVTCLYKPFIHFHRKKNSQCLHFLEKPDIMIYTDFATFVCFGRDKRETCYVIKLWDTVEIKKYKQ